MKLHVYSFSIYICLFALDFVSQVPLHRIPHCDITRSIIINKISTCHKTFNSFIIFFIFYTSLLVKNKNRYEEITKKIIFKVSIVSI